MSLPGHGRQGNQPLLPEPRIHRTWANYSASPPYPQGK